MDTISVALRPPGDETQLETKPNLGDETQLEARSASVNSLLCVGLDPHVSDLGSAVSAASAEAFCVRLITA